jgi:hypothetical protein
VNINLCHIRQDCHSFVLFDTLLWSQHIAMQCLKTQSILSKSRCGSSSLFNSHCIMLPQFQVPWPLSTHMRPRNEAWCKVLSWGRSMRACQICDWISIQREYQHDRYFHYRRNLNAISRRIFLTIVGSIQDKLGMKRIVAITFV